MTKRENILLIILGIVFIGAIFYLTIEWSVSSINESEKSISRYTDMIKKINETKKAPAIEKQTKKVFSDINKTETIEKILQDLNTFGIKPQKYQVINNTNGFFIETNIVCSSSLLIPYLAAIEKNKTVYSITNMNIKNNEDSISATIRYELKEIEFINNNKEINSRKIVNVFRPKRIEKVEVTKVQTKNEEVKEQIKDETATYSIIGWIKEGNSSYLYIKQKNINKLIKIVPENILEETTDYVIIQFDERKIKIQKRR